MRKVIILLFLFVIIGSCHASITTTIEPKLNAKNMLFPVGNTGKQISLFDLSRISIDDFQALTGRKMNFFDKMGFKIAQKKVRNHINVDGTINSKKLEKFLKQRGGETGFHLGGFALGFLLGLIGVLIAYLINDDYKKNRVKWAWIGCGIVVVLNIILIVAVWNSVN